MVVLHEWLVAISEKDGRSAIASSRPVLLHGRCALILGYPPSSAMLSWSPSPASPLLFWLLSP